MKTIEPRGYCGLAVYASKSPANLGTIWRTAHCLGASFVARVGPIRYPADRIPRHLPPPRTDQTDTMVTLRHVPYLQVETIEGLRQALPFARLVAIELDGASEPLPAFKHPERAIYLVGAEDGGIPRAVLDCMDAIVQIPGSHCLNQAVAASIVAYDRIAKGG